MPLNTAAAAVISHRRRLVAQLRLREFAQDEIVAALEQQGIVNPKTGKPWSKGIINADCQALEAAWHEQAVKTTAEMKIEMFARLREVARAAWGKNDLRSVLQALKQQAELLGLDAPLKVDRDVRIGEWADELGLSPEERAELARDVQEFLRAKP